MTERLTASYADSVLSLSLSNESELTLHKAFVHVRILGLKKGNSQKTLLSSFTEGLNRQSGRVEAKPSEASDLV